MKAWFRLVTIAACLAALALLAGCNGQTPPSMREDTTSQNAAPAAEPQAAEAPAEATTSPASAETTEAGQAESKPAESKPEEPAEQRTQYEASLASAGVAVGAELQHTADWKLGGKLWAMTVDGKADASGQKPKVLLIAVGEGGQRTVIVEISGDAGTSSVQGDTIVPVPPKTTKLIVSTTLAPSGKPGGPELVIPLAEVPSVPALTLVKPGE